VATCRHNTQHAQAEVAPKCGGRTTRVLLVFAAGSENRGRPTHSRAEVRVIVRCIANTLRRSAQQLLFKLRGPRPACRSRRGATAATFAPR
jgi:hypothetical protein